MCIPDVLSQQPVLESPWMGTKTCQAQQLRNESCHCCFLCALCLVGHNGNTRLEKHCQICLLPQSSEKIPTLLSATLRSWDVLCSSCSRVPAKDSLVVHGVLSLTWTLLPRVVEFASSPCWIATCFKTLAGLWPAFRRLWDVPVCSLLWCSVHDDSVRFWIDTRQEHERTIMNISWPKPWQTRGCSISDDVSRAVGKNSTSDRLVTPAGRCARMNQRSATVSAARTTGGKSTFFSNILGKGDDTGGGEGKKVKEGLFYHLFSPCQNHGRRHRQSSTTLKKNLVS